LSSKLDHYIMCTEYTGSPVVAKLALQATDDSFILSKDLL
jgi:hypothetical protein